MRSAYGARAGRAWSARALRSAYGAGAECARSACALRSALRALRPQRPGGAVHIPECVRGSYTSPCAGTECVRSASGACPGCEESLLLSEGHKQWGGGGIAAGSTLSGCGPSCPLLQRGAFPWEHRSHGGPSAVSVAVSPLPSEASFSQLSRLPS